MHILSDVILSIFSGSYFLMTVFRIAALPKYIYPGEQFLGVLILFIDRWGHKSFATDPTWDNNL